MQGLGKELCDNIVTRIAEMAELKESKAEAKVAAWIQYIDDLRNGVIRHENPYNYRNGVVSTELLNACSFCGGPLKRNGACIHATRPCFQSYCSERLEDYICQVCGLQITCRECNLTCTKCDALVCKNGYCSARCQYCDKWACRACYEPCSDCKNPTCPYCQDHYCRVQKKRRKLGDD